MVLGEQQKARCVGIVMGEWRDGPELLTNEQCREADQGAVAAGVPFITLMENAGRAVAQEAARMVPAGGRIAVLCGPGNNGGDGFVAARYLRQWGIGVDVALLGDRSALSGDAAVMAARWPGATLSCGDLDFARADLIIDALFGAGLSRPIAGDVAEIIARINAGPPILAVDVPSGIHGTTGEFMGIAVHATRTVTFFRKKPGHLLMPGRACSGRVTVADIGIPESVLDACRTEPTFANRPVLWRHLLPTPRDQAHKYTRGHTIVVSGPPEMTGAARLGARGALRAGSGLVTVATSRAAFPINAAHLTAIMLAPFEVPRGLERVLADARRNAVLIGPGATVGAATREMVAIALKSGASAVLDADALTSFALAQAGDPNSGGSGDGPLGFLPRSSEAAPATPEALFALIHDAQAEDALRRTASTSRRQSHIVLTPHEGEFKRLFGESAGSKLERARSAARTSRAIIVLKGPDTIIASPDGRAAINDNAPPWLATAGSGDVLAGFVTGLLAQGMSAFEAACAAVWLHGACATAFGPGLIAEDLPEQLPGVLRELLAGANGEVS